MPSPLIPWLVLPHNKTYKNLQFFDLSSGKVHRFELPNRLYGGVCCASSKGWLLVAKQKAQESLSLIKKLIYVGRKMIFPLISLILPIPSPDTDELFLFNPLSGALHELPSLSTFPLYDTCVGARSIVSDFIVSFQLSSPDPSESMVIAVVIRHPKVRFNVALALCKLGDKEWSIVHECDEGIDDVVGSLDILFRNGTLYVLSSFLDMESVNHHNFQLGDSAVSIKVVPDRTGKLYELFQRIEPSHLPGIAVWRPGHLFHYLVESAVGGEVLLISKDYDTYFRAEYEPDSDFPIRSKPTEYIYHKTVGFTVFKLDPDTGGVDRIGNLSEQAIFLGFGEAVSVAASNLPHGIEGNCVFFADDWNYIFENQNQLPFVSRESGVYCIETGKITRSQVLKFLVRAIFVGSYQQTIDINSWWL